MKTWLKALLVGALAFGPGAALAAIDNTHHDVPYLGQSTERCAYCHSKTNVTAVSTLKKVGGFCVAVCHLTGTGIATALPNAVPTSPGTFSWSAGTFTQGATVSNATIFTGGHGMDKAVLNVNFATEATAVTNTGWPYTAGNSLECTSCHSVHDAGNPPFLNDRLTDGTQGGGFCQRCHNSAIRQQTFATAGNHPIEFKWDVTAANGRTVAKGSDPATIMNRRELVVGSGVTNINVVAAGVANGASAGALNATNAHWNLGGHVVSNVTGLPTTGASATATDDQVGCYSCHPVHVATGGGTNPTGNLLTVGTDLSTVCYGCHTQEPGRTNYGHPILPDVPLANALWSAIPLTATYTGLNAMFRPTALADAPLCVSCHDVHDGFTGRMAIRKIAATLNTDGAACELCHAASFANPTTANQHHPGAATTDYTTNGFPTNTSWTTLDGLGDLNDGLSCPDCHVGDGTPAKRATAHNWQ